MLQRLRNRRRYYTNTIIIIRDRCISTVTFGVSSLLRLLAGAASPAQLRLCIDPKNYSVAAAIMPAAAAAAACNDDDARDATAPRCSDADKAPAFACSVRYDDNNHGQQPKQLAINSVRTARETDCPQAIRIC